MKIGHDLMVGLLQLRCAQEVAFLWVRTQWDIVNPKVVQFGSLINSKKGGSLQR